MFCRSGKKYAAMYRTPSSWLFECCYWTSTHGMNGLHSLIHFHIFSDFFSCQRVSIFRKVADEIVSVIGQFRQLPARYKIMSPAEAEWLQAAVAKHTASYAGLRVRKYLHGRNHLSLDWASCCPRQRSLYRCLDSRLQAFKCLLLQYGRQKKITCRNAGKLGVHLLSAMSNSNYLTHNSMQTLSRSSCFCIRIHFHFEVTVTDTIVICSPGFSLKTSFTSCIITCSFIRIMVDTSFIVHF